MFEFLQQNPVQPASFLDGTQYYCSLLTAPSLNSNLAIYVPIYLATSDYMYANVFNILLCFYFPGALVEPVALCGFCK